MLGPASLNELLSIGWPIPTIAPFKTAWTLPNIPARAKTDEPPRPGPDIAHACVVYLLLGTMVMLGNGARKRCKNENLGTVSPNVYFI